METRKQIEILIFLNDESEFPKRNVSTKKAEQVSTETATSEVLSAIPFPESTMVELAREDRDDRSLLLSVRSSTETQEAAAVSESAVAENVTPYSEIKPVPVEQSDWISPLLEATTETQTSTPIFR